MNQKIRNTIHYIHEVMGIQVVLTYLEKAFLDKLPFYIREKYKLYKTTLYNTEIILVALKDEEYLSILQAEKHISQIRVVLHLKVVLVLENVPAYNRKRLIGKGINFIVPGKQLFLPELLIDLREGNAGKKAKQKSEKLLPSAQSLLIYYIIHRDENRSLEELTFKEIANKLGYTPMTITNIVENLKYHELVEATGTKEKFVRFCYDRNGLWSTSLQKDLLVSPVFKTVYFDDKPEGVSLLSANMSALSEYTDMSPGRQQFFAIEKTVYYSLNKRNALLNVNEHEGRYALEVWKYNPQTLVGEIHVDKPAVDPLSLCLSLKEVKDERVELALEQIIARYVW